jgi:hypothetical protein
MARKIAVPKDFKVGDIVLVECSGAAIRKSAKWQNNWTASMEGAVGKCLEVKRENTGYGVGLAFNDGIFGFPEKVLRLIKRGDKTYFREGDKVLVARKSETVHWNDSGKMDETLGKVYEVTASGLRSQADNYRPAVSLSTETGWWFYGTDSLELYTGQVTDEQPQPTATFTINEPLQSWERF